MRPAATFLTECKSRIRPVSGKDIAEGKGVHREVESEGSRMWEQTNHGQNLRSDEQKLHRRPCMRVRLLYKPKPDNYTESCMVNVTDGWEKETCGTRGGLCGMP